MPNHIPPLDLHIPSLIDLFKTNPNAAQLLHRALIEHAIESTPEHLHKRLRGLQFQVDMQNRKSKSQYQTLDNLSSMMFDSLRALQTQLQFLLTIAEGGCVPETAPVVGTQKTAKVLYLNA